MPIVVGALGTIPKGSVKGQGNWKLDNKWRPPRLQHYWDRPENSWRFEATCWHSLSCEKPSTNVGLKNSQMIKDWNNNNSNNNNNQQKKRICKNVDFTVLADHRIKLKECEKKAKDLDVARELKKLWNMQVASIQVVTGAFGTVTKRLLKELEDLDVGGLEDTIQTTALLRTARILRKVQDTWGDLLQLTLQWKTIS